MQRETLALGTKLNSQEKEAETDVRTMGDIHVSVHVKNMLTVSQANVYSGLNHVS